MNNYLSNTMEFIIAKLRKEREEVRDAYFVHRASTNEFVVVFHLPSKYKRHGFEVVKRVEVSIYDTQIATTPPHVIVNELVQVIESEVNGDVNT